jgi:hypothetical protein
MGNFSLPEVGPFAGMQDTCCKGDPVRCNVTRAARGTRKVSLVVVCVAPRIWSEFFGGFWLSNEEVQKS